MADSKYIKFMEKLIDYTKAGKLVWNYLDNFPKFCDRMGFFRNAFNVEKSFIATYEEMRIVILQKDKSPASIYIVPSTFKNIVQLKSSDLGEYITRLQNIVMLQFPDADRFIDSFLAEDNSQKSD